MSHSLDAAFDCLNLSWTGQFEDRLLQYNPLQRKGACSFFTLPKVLLELMDMDPEDNVHLLSSNHRDYLLRHSKHFREIEISKGRSVHARLTNLDPEMAQCYAIKHLAVESLKFRLINQRMPSDVRETSYIALSYCWPENTRAVLSTSQQAEGTKIPIGEMLFQAFANERIGADEGMWIDQICIDQQDQAEKNISIGAMDSVYRHARVVIAVLADLEVTLDEQEFLSDYILDFEDDRWDKLKIPHASENTPWFHGSGSKLKLFLAKVLSSKWFTRAWCFHEMKLGQKHVFVLPCQAEAGSEYNTCLGFTSFFLFQMVRLSAEVPFERSLQAIRNRVSIILDPYEAARKQVKLAKNSTRASSYKHVNDGTLDDLWTLQLNNAVKLDANGNPTLPDHLRITDAYCDRISIFLNIVGSGLALKRNKLSVAYDEAMTLQECLILALAANDPLVLCTVGEPLRLGGDKEGYSWLHQPHLLDLGSGRNRQGLLPLLDTPSIKTDCGKTRRWIELEMIVFGTGELPSDKWQDLAARIIEKCIELDMGKAPDGAISGWGVGPEYQYWRSQTDIFKILHGRFTMTLACVLTCGIEWLFGVTSKCGYLNPERLRNDITRFFHEDFNYNEMQSMSWATSEPGRAAMSAIFRCTNWLCGLSSTEYGPMLYNHPYRGKAVIFSNIEAGHIAAMPKCLAADDYARLSRVWILGVDIARDKDGPESPQYSLYRKAILYSTWSADAILNAAQGLGSDLGWTFHDAFRVYGRPAGTSSD